MSLLHVEGYVKHGEKNFCTDLDFGRFENFQVTYHRRSPHKHVSTHNGRSKILDYINLMHVHVQTVTVVCFSEP